MGPVIIGEWQFSCGISLDMVLLDLGSIVLQVVAAAVNASGSSAGLEPAFLALFS